jgi:phospholipase C
MGTEGPSDQFGPGTRIPALLISSSLTQSGVDHRSYDTTSIMATIEHQFGLAPVDHPAGVIPRDRLVADLGHAVKVGRPSGT